MMPMKEQLSELVETIKLIDLFTHFHRFVNNSFISSS